MSAPASGPRPDRPDPSDPTTRRIRAALVGDRDAVAWLVERFSPWLLAQAHYRMGERLQRFVEPEDVVEEVWAAALPRLGDFEVRGPRATPVVLRFLSTMLLHRVNGLLRTMIRRRQVRLDASAATGLTWQGRGPLTSAARREGIQVVLDALEGLASGDREVLVLRCIEQRTARECAELLGVTDRAVYVRQHRALKRLRSRLPRTMVSEVLGGEAADAGD